MIHENELIVVTVGTSSVDGNLISRTIVPEWKQLGAAFTEQIQNVTPTFDQFDRLFVDLEVAHIDIADILEQPHLAQPSAHAARRGQTNFPLKRFDVLRR